MRIATEEFKARCLEAVHAVVDHCEEVLITEDGRPVAKLVPLKSADASPAFGRMKGTVTILGDIVEPTGESWDADE